MARVTVEDCIDKVDDRFELVIVSAQRAKQLYNGSPALIEKVKNDKNTVLSLREIEQDALNIPQIKEEVLRGFRKNIEFRDLEESNAELEFIEKEILNEVVFEDNNEELNNVSEEELSSVVA